MNVKTGLTGWTQAVRAVVTRWWQEQLGSSVTLSTLSLPPAMRGLSTLPPHQTWQADLWDAFPQFRQVCHSILAFKPFIVSIETLEVLLKNSRYIRKAC